MRRRTKQEAWTAHVDRRGDDECWPWTGLRDEHGYGRCSAEGSRFQAHRLAFEIASGTQPSGVVRHTCDHTWCQNPSHLLDGTQADNNRDKIERGRGWTPLGETHGRAKLTERSVRELRAAHLAGVTIAELSRRFGVTASTVSKCIHRRTWSHVN